MTASATGKTLLELLARRFTYHTRDEWRVLVEEGRLRINGCPAMPRRELCAGDEVQFDIPDQEEPSVNTNYTIIFEDDSLLAVNKPPDLPCHPSGRYFRNTLWFMLKRCGPKLDRAFMNRLDRETSGVVLLAGPKAARSACRRQFEAGQVEKRYCVLVEGHIPDRITADGWIGPDDDSPIRKKQRFSTLARPGSKRAKTAFRRICVGKEISIVEAVPVTGRLHQIRATLLSLGYPVVGDKMYGRDETVFLRFISGTMTQADEKLMRLGRQALHAASLGIRHPDTGENIVFEAPLPADMAAVRGTAC